MGLVVEADAGLPAVPVRCEWPDSTLIAIVDPLWLGTGTSISLLTNHSSADCSHRTPTINIFESYRDTSASSTLTIALYAGRVKNCNSWGRRIFTIYDHNYRGL